MTRGLERHVFQVLARGRSPSRFLNKRPCYVTQAGGAGRGRGRGNVAPADQGWTPPAATDQGWTLPAAGIGHGTVGDAPSFGRGRGYGIINVSERIGRLEAPPRVVPDHQSQLGHQSQQGQLPVSSVQQPPSAGIPSGQPRYEIPPNMRTWSASSQQHAKVNPVQFHQSVGNNPEQTMNTNLAQFHQNPEYTPTAQPQAWPQGQLQNQPPTYHPYQYPNYYPPWPPQVVHHPQGTDIHPQQNLPLQVQPPQLGQTFSPRPLPHPVTTYRGEHPVPSAASGQVPNIQGSNTGVPYYQGAASASHQVPYQGVPPSQAPYGQMPVAAGQHPDPRGNVFGTHAQAYQHESFTGHEPAGSPQYSQPYNIQPPPQNAPQYSQPYNAQPPSQNAPQYSQPYNAQPPSQNAPQHSQPYNVQLPSQDARGYPVYSAAGESMYQAPYQSQYPEFSQHQHQKAIIHGGTQSSAQPSDSRADYQAQVHPSSSQPQTPPYQETQPQPPTQPYQQTQPHQHWQTVPGIQYPTYSHPQMPYQYGVQWYQGWYSNQVRPGLQPPPVAHSNVIPGTQTGIYQPSASSAIPQQQVVQRRPGPPEVAASADQVSAPVASPHYHPHGWPPPAQNFMYQSGVAPQPLSHPIPAQVQTVLSQGIQQEMVTAGVEEGSQSVSVGLPAVPASPQPRGTVSQLPLQQQAGSYGAVQVPGQQFVPPLGADQRAPFQAPQGDQSQARKAQKVGQPEPVSKPQVPVDAARAPVGSPQMAPHGMQPLSQTQTAAKDTQPGQKIQSIFAHLEGAGNLQPKVQTEPAVSTVRTDVKDTKEDDSTKPSLGFKLDPRSVRALEVGRGKPLKLKNETAPGIDVSGEFVFRQPDASLRLSLFVTDPEVDVRAHLPMPFESRLNRGRGTPLSPPPIGSQRRVEMRKPQLSKEEAAERALAILQKGMENATMTAGSRERSKRLSMVPSGNIRMRSTGAITQATGPRTAKTRRTRLEETEAEATARWRKELALRNLTPEQAEAAETSMIFNKMVIDTYHTHCLYEFEPEYAMEDFGQNPVIEDVQPPTLEETIEKAKPLLMPLCGFMDDKQWEDTVQEVIKDVPSLKKIVERYAGPPRKTANKQNRELEAIAAKLPAYVPTELSAFTQRALVTMKNNPSWNLLQKKQMLSNYVTNFARHS